MSTIADTLDKFEAIAVKEIDTLSHESAKGFPLDLDDVRKMDLLATLLIRLEAHQHKRDKGLVDGKTPEQLEAMLEDE